MADNVTITHCSICEQVCGLKVTVAGDRIESIKPDQDNPYSWRDYCIKGARAGDIRDHPDRLRTPMRRVGNRYEPATYEEAIDDIASRLRVIIDAHGPDAIGSYSGNPGGFAFSAYSFLAALMEAIGSRSIFSVGSVDQNAVLVAAEAMFGSELVTLLPDIDECDHFLLIGANPAISKMNWMGKVPEGWRRILDRVGGGASLVVVDPRLTETARKATDHVAVRPEQDWALLLGMIHVIFRDGLATIEYAERIAGLDQLRTLAAAQSLDELAGRCDIAPDRIEALARNFATAKTAAAIARTGTAQGRNGAITEWLVMVLNIITNRIETPGGRFMPG